MRRLWTPVTIALLLSISEGTFRPGRVVTRSFETRSHRARDASRGSPRGASQRIADREIARRVRGAIRADPFLALTTPLVNVTTNRGVVRLVGRVRTDKERSSIAFKAGQTPGVERIDDRVTIGNGVERATW